MASTTDPLQSYLKCLPVLALLAATPVLASDAPALVTGVNLLQNPGEESGVLQPDGTLSVPGWQTTGSLHGYGYGSTTVPSSEITRISGGAAGFGARDSVGTAAQSVSIASDSTAVDSGQRTATLSAYIFFNSSWGGGSGQVYATFFNGSGSNVGSIVLPVVSTQSSTYRFQSGTAPVPVGTRSVLVTLSAKPDYQAAVYLDNVYFALNAVDPTSLFISDQPGDNRFKIQVSWNTVQGGGQSGNGTAIPLASVGLESAGVFWFFGSTNPEAIVKVINGCSVNGAYWVFYSAGTNVGMTTTVTDTKTSRVKSYQNPDLTPAAPVQDVTAFACP